MKKIRLILLIIVIGGGFYLSYEYYFKEYGMYKEAMGSTSDYYAVEYIINYPEGRWIDEVREQKLYLQYQRVARSMEINSIRRFRVDHPNSKYDEQLVQWSDSLWNYEINHYEEISKTKGTDSRSVKFFRDLMYYMRDNHMSTLFVKFDRNIELKDFNEYPSQAQVLLDQDAQRYKDPLISENVLSLRKNFDMGEADKLEKIVDNGIAKSLENIFEQKIMYVSTWDDSYEEEYAGYPIIEVEYNIRNAAFFAKELGIIYPDVWTYTIDGKFQTYVLGINIDFKFDFKIPTSDQLYTFTTSADPGQSLSNMKDVRDAYRLMTQVTFQHYAQEISDRFGLGAAASDVSSVSTQ